MWAYLIVAVFVFLFGKITYKQTISPFENFVTRLVMSLLWPVLLLATIVMIATGEARITRKR